jgi:radical SAM protein with 4Fe4S-binding SPASM domain
MSGPHIHASTEMPPDQWRRLIDDIASAGGRSVLFTGGEPLIRCACTGLIRHAKNSGLQVTLFTNGLMVGKRLAAIKDHVDLVQVSMNGPDAATNDPIRGEGTFRAATDAVDLLVGAGVQVRIGITVMERNWPALKERFRQLVERYEGSSVNFHLGYGLCRYGRAKSIDDQLDLEEIRPELNEMVVSANRIQTPRVTRKTVNCGYCEQLVVAPDGQVYPCHLLDGTLGHIWDKPLSAWYAYLRETARLHSVDRIRGCRDCDLRNLCGGTCRVINRQETGSKWLTTCTEKERRARYRNLVRLFNENELTGVSVID